MILLCPMGAKDCSTQTTVWISRLTTTCWSKREVQRSHCPITPQMFLLTCLPMFPHRHRPSNSCDVVTTYEDIINYLENIFRRLTSGKNLIHREIFNYYRISYHRVIELFFKHTTLLYMIPQHNASLNCSL